MLLTLLAIRHRAAIHDRLAWLAENFPDEGFGPCRFGRSVCECHMIVRRRYPGSYPDMAPTLPLPGWLS